MRKSRFRVRVMRFTEEWVEVDAHSPADAEKEALALPRVARVFGKSALPATENGHDDAIEGLGVTE